MKSNVLAGIIVYKPDQNLINLVDELISQNAFVLLIINQGNIISQEVIETRKVEYFVPRENVGVSEALNIIINEFKKNKFDFLLTFDQDSMIYNNFIRNMLKVFIKAQINDENIVCCSPKILDLKFGNYNSSLVDKNPNYSYQYINFAITSGSLFSKKSFEKVGNMNSLLFIDGVDTDWCERALLAKCKLIKADEVFLNHKIGIKYINFFGFKKSYHDQDLRVYYIIRNSLYLLFYGKNTFRWKISELLRTIIRLIAYPYLSSTKLNTLIYIYLAFKDFLLKNMGKMNYLEH